jgi:hypothetical protein
VLIDSRIDAEGMAIALLVFILLIGPLALLFGPDSRLDERAHGAEWRRI